MSDYVVTKSNYTIKKEHAKNSVGTVYERDFMATNNLGGWDSGSIPYSENGFKIVRRKDIPFARKHKYGEWISKEDGSVEWTINDIESNGGVSDESKIVIKPNSHSMLDFAYYGSCTELLRVSIDNIIKYFPAEIYFTSKVYERGVLDEKYKDTKWYIIDNPFNINIWDTIFKSDDEYYNIFRYFSLSSSRYSLLNSNDASQGCIDGKWTSKPKNFKYCNGTVSHEIDINGIEIIRYFIDDKFILLYNGDKSLSYNYYIRLECKDDITSSFEAMNDFEKILLNRESNPLYTCVLDFPHETENGIETYRKQFTWPTYTYKVSDGKYHMFNIDITSQEYERYVEKLLELCNFYDEHQTDNLWRMMTHDSIKNLDNTFVKENSIEDEEDYSLGVSKLHAFLSACARQFDEIKRQIANISSTNCITYGGDNNLPDYFLSDTLELSGWEVCSAVETLDRTKTVSGLFNNNKTYTMSDANVRFLTNLKLNSKDIFSRKGTKYGLEMLLGMFGMVSKDFDGGKYDYELKEYVSVAETKFDNIGSLNTDLPAEKFNKLKKGNEEVAYFLNDFETTLEGLPVKAIVFTENGVQKKCIVPYFKKDKKIDGNPYFQMYGGWGKQDSKKIDKFKTINGNFIYEETLKYLHIVNNINDLTNVSPSILHGDDIIYVINEDENNYYQLKSPENYKIIGDDGWKPISSGDTRVIYLESIIDEYRGNNPHVGYGNYDDGDEYYKYFDAIFYYSFKHYNFVDEAYDCEGGLDEDILTCGFGTYEVLDNVKCWFFNDTSKMSGKRLHNDNGTAVSFPVIGEDADLHYSSELEPVNLTTSSKTISTSVYAADSVINDKTLEIVFKYPEYAYSDDEKKKFEEYIKICVLPYAYQVIPSTTILKINFN